jgi:hypothetical protein
MTAGFISIRSMAAANPFYNTAAMKSRSGGPPQTRSEQVLPVLAAPSGAAVFEFRSGLF